MRRAGPSTGGSSEQEQFVVVFREANEQAKMAYEFLAEAGLDPFALDSPVTRTVPLRQGGAEPGKVRIAVPVEQGDEARDLIEAWLADSTDRASQAERELVKQLLIAAAVGGLVAAGVALLTRDKTWTVLAFLFSLVGWLQLRRIMDKE
ncbi:MAG: hypothetical protein ACLFUJ_09790 [Phycisphaerae bacterium]